MRTHYRSPTRTKIRYDKKLTTVSKAFAGSSNKYLQQSVDEAGGASGRIVFAPVFVEPPSAFGSPGSGFAAPKKTSLLWTSRASSTGRESLSKFFYVLFALNFSAFQPNDQVYVDRKVVCKDADKGITCRVAAYGHPNTKGVDAYVEQVKAKLQSWLEKGDWLKPESSEQ